MPDNLNNTNECMIYTCQSVVINSFYQMPRFLTTGVFEGSKLSNNARILYTLLLDRHKVSVKNGWFDENGEVYIFYKKEEMEKHLGLSKVTVIKVMRELKELFLVKEKKQGLNMPNKIYILFPVIADNEPQTPHICPENDNSLDEVYNETSNEKYVHYDT